MIKNKELEELTNRISHHLTEYFYAIDDLNNEYNMIEGSKGQPVEHLLFKTLGDKEKIFKMLVSAIKEN